ncbi:hypothetical protein, partial [Trichocoleus sp. FACHB-591]|uniref:hypothetical protein n=1 Tax=Trichocoleus sp. FACHB-591 TaxID=2692872 RepID=UPI001A7E9194
CYSTAFYKQWSFLEAISTSLPLTKKVVMVCHTKHVLSLNLSSLKGELGRRAIAQLSTVQTLAGLFYL